MRLILQLQCTGFNLEDDSSTVQSIVAGNTLKVSSGSGISALYQQQIL